VYFDGRITARRDSSANVFFFFADHLGSTRVVTNSTGVPCYQVDYYPYGGELTPSGVTNTCPTNYRFTGYERDPETAVGGINGLDYAIGRYYNSRIGRFMSADRIDGDPSGPQSWNAYSYVVNNPLNATDPSGLDTVFQVWSISTASTVFGDAFGPFGGLGGFSSVGVGDPTLMTLWTPSGFNTSLPGWDLQRALSGHSSLASAPSMPQSVGAPGFAESLIPIWGSGRAAINDFQTGHWGWGLVNTGLAISDVFLVKSLVTAAGKVGVAGLVRLGGSETWGAAKGWMVRNGWREFKGQPFHHWLIPQGEWGKVVPGLIKNQPWNILRISEEGVSDGLHIMLHGGTTGAGETMGIAQRLLMGSPTWAKVLLINMGLRGASQFEPQW